MKYALSLMGFGVLCLLLAGIFAIDVGEAKSTVLSSEGGSFGPLVVAEANSVYEITVSSPVALREWSSIDVDVLDGDKAYLFSFSDETWHESGHDSDGHWQEHKSQFEINITFREPGQYYFEISAQRNHSPGNRVTMQVTEELGSVKLFVWVGVISLVIGFLMIFVIAKFLDGAKSSRPRPKSKKSEEADNAQGKTRVSPVFAGFSGLLLVVLLVTFVFSAQGWGYMGYYGYLQKPLLMGGPTVFTSPSARDGSMGGAGHRGGGFGGGK